MIQSARTLHGCLPPHPCTPVPAQLGRATGQRYRVAVAPGDGPYLPDGAVRESAIVVNADTVRTVGTPGFHRVQSEDQAYAVVETRARPALRAPLVSAHVAGSPAPAAARSRWRTWRSAARPPRSGRA
ncbi:hypothetical protein ACHZ98_14485 [Streptomyces sp. MAR4 CNY-716]